MILKDMVELGMSIGALVLCSSEQIEVLEKAVDHWVGGKLEVIQAQEVQSVVLEEHELEHA